MSKRDPTVTKILQFIVTVGFSQLPSLLTYPLFQVLREPIKLTSREVGLIRDLE